MVRVKWWLLVVHVAGWLLFMAFPLLFMNSDIRGGNAIQLLLSPWYWLFCFTYIALFYLNGYLLFPWLFLKRRYFAYALAGVLLYTGIHFLQPYDKLVRRNELQRTNISAVTRMQEGQMPPPMNVDPGSMPPPQDVGFGNGRDPRPPGGPPPNAPGIPRRYLPGPGAGHFGGHKPFDTTSLFLFVMIMALSTATKTIQQWQRTEQRAAQAEADKASAELSFLKAQINPHFLFNTLNNIYTLAVIKDDHAPDSIMKLSNIMRYVTDDANADFVALQSEADCITDYIELQRLRLGQKTTVKFDISGDIAQKQIAPLILMTFVENVFKYGVSKHEKSVIDIKISAVANEIAFFCENRIFKDVNENNRTGIGLKNTRKRLEHLYPGRHLLVINNTNDLYTVNLTLQT